MDLENVRNAMVQKSVEPVEDIRFILWEQNLWNVKGVMLVYVRLVTSITELQVPIRDQQVFNSFNISYGAKR